MNSNININNSSIDLAYLNICFKEFLNKSQLVLNDLEKKYSNSDNSYFLAYDFYDAPYYEQN